MVPVVLVKYQWYMITECVVLELPTVPLLQVRNKKIVCFKTFLFYVQRLNHEKWECLIIIILIGFQVDFSHFLQSDEVKAFHHFNQVIQVYSNSWGPDDNGYTVQGPQTLTAAALVEGVQSVSIWGWYLWYWILVLEKLKYYFVTKTQNNNLL